MGVIKTFREFINESIWSDMQEMFKGCKNFNCDLSKWDISNVNDMKDMFNDCKSLKQIPLWYKE